MVSHKACLFILWVRTCEWTSCAFSSRCMHGENELLCLYLQRQLIQTMSASFIVELPHVHLRFFMWSCWCLSPFCACLFNRCYIIIMLEFQGSWGLCVWWHRDMSKIDVLTLLRQHLFAFWICTPWSWIRTSVHRQLNYYGWIVKASLVICYGNFYVFMYVINS
jgi:hypothetical protein